MSSHQNDQRSNNECISQDYLDSLLEKAKRKALEADVAEDDVITLESKDQEKLPLLNPGKVPEPYFIFGKSRSSGLASMRDPDAENVEKIASTSALPAPPIPPPELTKSGKPLTRRERKALRNQTAGPDWFELPAPSEAELPGLYREVEALRLRNQLDPKRFYRKEEGEDKGIKGLPKYFAIGTIVPTSTTFGTTSADNLTRAHRKRTLVDELVDDSEARSYAKRKFESLQTVRSAKGKGTLAQKQALRKSKW